MIFHNEKPLSFHVKNRKFLIMSKLFTAIIFFKPETGISPRKYRNINNPQNFLKFAEKCGGWYVNLYCKRSAKFEARKYVKNDSWHKHQHWKNENGAFCPFFYTKGERKVILTKLGQVRSVSGRSVFAWRLGVWVKKTPQRGVFLNPYSDPIFNFSDLKFVLLENFQ